MFGGDHGKLKHGPPEAHSPVVESLLAKEELKISPCFHFGYLHKGIIMGPVEIQEHVAFVPHPVETANVSVWVLGICMFMFQGVNLL